MRANSVLPAAAEEANDLRNRLLDLSDRLARARDLSNAAFLAAEGVKQRELATLTAVIADDLEALRAEVDELHERATGEDEEERFQRECDEAETALAELRERDGR